MSTCWKCGKSGVFLRVGKSSGLCIDCLEQLAESNIKLISMLKAGESDRKKALEMVDAVAGEEMAESVAKELTESPFGIWKKEIHASPNQVERIRRSKSVVILSFDSTTGQAMTKSSGKEPYVTSYDSCTCGDFINRHLPCKHMYKLAKEYGHVDFLKALEKNN